MPKTSQSQAGLKLYPNCTHSPRSQPSTSWTETRGSIVKTGTIWAHSRRPTPTTWTKARSWWPTVGTPSATARPRMTCTDPSSSTSRCARMRRPLSSTWLRTSQSMGWLLVFTAIRAQLRNLNKLGWEAAWKCNATLHLTQARKSTPFPELRLTCGVEFINRSRI